MKIIVGLGNPGPKYENTRHNIGYRVVEAAVKLQGLRFKRSFRFNGLIARGNIFDTAVIFFKPCSFMNNSGSCLKKFLSGFRDEFNILIVYDDVDLDLGTIRFRQKGTAAGHRGMDSIIKALGRNNLNRLRLGIGRPQNPAADVSDYVLSEFFRGETDAVNTVIGEAARACCDWAARGDEYVMKNYNKKINYH